jgi:hypothetical protein
MQPSSCISSLPLTQKGTTLLLPLPDRGSRNILSPKPTLALPRNELAEPVVAQVEPSPNDDSDIYRE